MKSINKYLTFRMKRSASGPSTSSAGKKAKKDDEKFITEIQHNREKLASNITEFKMNRKRIRMLNDNELVPENKNGICYWMARDQRVQDNWALLFAQKLGYKNKLPLHVIFCLTDKFMDATLRHFKFMLDGLEEVSEDLDKLNINFHLLRGNHTTQIPKFVKDFNIGALVCDFSPLRIHREWVDGINDKLPANVPFIQVDAHNIVPVWAASDKQEYAARTIRNKINNKLDEFLTEFPPLVKHPYKAEKSHQSEKIDWEGALDSIKADKSVKEVDWIEPGYRAGIEMLESFINVRLKYYDQDRNNPNKTALSNLSPFFHFGHIAAQRAILEVKKYKSKNPKGVEGFMEEAIVRRELSDNFCYYNKNYDNLKGLADWAKKTLDDHRKDKREYIYTLKEFDEAKTHDDLWNSAQLQMKNEGKMHGFLRMYWAKKILEWTKTPEEALEFAIHLNDRYNLDGRDPNGFVGK